MIRNRNRFVSQVDDQGYMNPSIGAEKLAEASAMWVYYQISSIQYSIWSLSSILNLYLTINVHRFDFERMTFDQHITFYYSPFFFYLIDLKGIFYFIFF